jgi:hypothetical protein
LSAIESDAVLAPVAVGLNSTEIVQLAPTARDVLQVVADFRKAVALFPVKPIVLKVTVLAPMFSIVTSCAALLDPTAVDPNASDAGEMVTVDGAAIAVPFRGTSCGEPVALSAMESDAVLAPVAVGLNSTEIVQFAPIARDVPHVVADFRKAVALFPVKLMVPRVMVPVPVF